MSATKPLSPISDDRDTSGAQLVPHTVTGADDSGKKSPIDTSRPTLQEYAAASETAYKLTTDDGKANKDFKAPDGFTVIKKSDESLLDDGFAAVALKDRNGNVIVAYEGTIIGGRGYNRHSLGADVGIAANEADTKALGHAVDFARQVEKETGQKVFVAGHSLGGIEAEAAAKSFESDKALAAKFGGGTTFGATGLPGNTDAGPASMRNYVKYGDTVGNDSSDHRVDALSPPSNNIAANQEHYGKVQMTGSPADAALLSRANESQDKMIEALMVPSLGSAVKATYEGGKAAGQFVSAIQQFHGIANYEKSLGLTPGAPPLYPFLSDDVHQDIAKLGSQLKDTGAQVVAQLAPAAGNSVSPDPIRLPGSGEVRNLS